MFWQFKIHMGLGGRPRRVTTGNGRQMYYFAERRTSGLVRAGGAAVGRVALDIGIVCPQAAVHLSAAQSQLGAAESYTLTKCSRAHMEDRCRAAGVVF